MSSTTDTDRPVGAIDDPDMGHFKKVEEYRAHVHPALKDIYDDLLGDGAAPRTAAATLCYLEGLYSGDRYAHPTQNEVGELYDISKTTIRKWASGVESDTKSELSDAGVLTESHMEYQNLSKAEALEELADVLGWEKSESRRGPDGDYCIHSNYHSNTNTFIEQSALEALVGTTNEIELLTGLRDQFGLDCDEGDLSISIQINKRGMVKLRDAVDDTDG